MAKETKGKTLEEIAGRFGDTVATETMNELITAHDNEVEQGPRVAKVN
jgi:hypothetical protein